MPHIRALFVENGEIINLLQEHRCTIRGIIADQMGYPPEQVAFFPEMIPGNLYRLTDNMLPLEFVIDAGTRCAGKTEEVNIKIKEALITGRPGAQLGRLNFGIWLRTMRDNNYIEHKPLSVAFDDKGPGVHLTS